MPKYNLTWQDTDAQLLDALLLATGGEGNTGLQDVLLMADAVDGTVFTLDELEQGLQKLLAVGFVTVQKNKLALTPEFLEKYEQITLQEDSATDNQKPLIKLLQQQPLSEEKIEEVRSTVLKKYKLKNHYQQYLEQFG
ncbi:hypothetical protein [Pontibacter vulgaris]|uniref:hypothetical protein n=1 Tax=Pontibacter vulgaris TaxID=2905679 RepID=UPI001FA7E05F|nr:hypothetical protein [Pontibacter vulgaris]